MRAARLTVPLLLVAGLAACSESVDPTMPDVLGQQLDVALTTISDAGITGEPEVEGGGLFGVVDESNWVVCEQTPLGGAATSSTPSLVVGRECGGDDPETSEEPTLSEEESSPEPEEAEPTAEPDETPASEPSQEPETLVTDKILTTESNGDFAALVLLTDYCSSDIENFAKVYAGRTIEFDGNVAYFNNHEGYSTRWDFLINAGDYDPDSSAGPEFQFRDVGRSDLNLDDGIDGLGIGDNIHIVAEVDKYIVEQCLFLLDPVAISAR